MDASRLNSLAEAHCRGFANVNRDPANKDIPSLAKGYASFFNSSMCTGYAPTGPQTFTSTSAGEANMSAWLNSLVAIGIDPFQGIAFKDIRIEVIASRVALCWMTNVFTPTGGEPFEFTLFYSYRVPIGKETGDWDFMISDPQLDMFMKKYPHFFEAAGAPMNMEGPKVFS